jgi:hypothetical protein
MADLDEYSRQLEGFRASDEARERLVSVRCLVACSHERPLLLC